MNKTSSKLVDFSEMIKFSLINFWASKYSTHEIPVPLDSNQLSVFKNLKTHINRNSRLKVVAKEGDENGKVLGFSLFHNIHDDLSDHVTFNAEDLDDYLGPEWLLNKSVNDSLQGMEGGYVLGGSLLDKVSPLVCPTPYAFVANKLLQMPGTQLLEKFLPNDFSYSNTKIKYKHTGSSRTQNTLGTALLGQHNSSDHSEVIVLKQSAYGSIGWGKLYRIRARVDREDGHYELKKYVFDEFYLDSLEQMKPDKSTKIYPDTVGVIRSYHLEGLENGIEQARLEPMSTDADTRYVLDVQALFKNKPRAEKTSQDYVVPENELQ